MNETNTKTVSEYELQNLLNEIYTLRAEYESVVRDVEQFNHEKDILLLQAQATPEYRLYKAYVEENAVVTQEADEIKSELASRMIELFQLTGDKTLKGVGGVRESTSITWDEVEARKWCLENKDFVTYLNVDKTFKNVAQNLTHDWVKRETKVSGTVAKVVLEESDGETE